MKSLLDLKKEFKKRKLRLSHCQETVEDLNDFLTIDLLKHNNVVSGDHPTLKDLGITGTPIKNILSKYIYRFRTGGQFG